MGDLNCKLNKTIVYVGGFQLPDKNAAAHRVLSNAKIFRELGYNVVFIDLCTEQNTELEKKEDCFGFKRWSILKSSKNLYSIKPVKNVIESLNNVEYIVAYNYPAISLLKLYYYSKKYNIKIIADITEWYGAQGENILHKMVKGLDSYLRMNIIHPKLDGAIVISKYLENFYKDKINTVCIPPLTDPNEEKWSMIYKEENNSNTINIVYAGQPGRNKDKLNIIIDSLSKNACKNFIFKIIGLNKNQYLDSYPADLEKLRLLDKNIVFMGRIPHIEAINEIKKSDFVLFFRNITRVTMAGFPTKFAEAITCGTPVITNKTSDLNAFLVEGKNGLWIEDITVDLSNILAKNIKELKSIKGNVDRYEFDYRKYIPKVKKFLN